MKSACWDSKYEYLSSARKIAPKMVLEPSTTRSRFLNTPPRWNDNIEKCYLWFYSTATAVPLDTLIGSIGHPTNGPLAEFDLKKPPRWMIPYPAMFISVGFCNRTNDFSGCTYIVVYPGSKHRRLRWLGRWSACLSRSVSWVQVSPSACS